MSDLEKLEKLYKLTKATDKLFQLLDDEGVDYVFPGTPQSSEVKGSIKMLRNIDRLTSIVIAEFRHGKELLKKRRSGR